MIESLWKTLESGLKHVAKGQSTDLNVAEVHRLVSEYTAHAGYEEAALLPLAEQILSRNSNHMAALGLSLHMRHVKPVNAYIRFTSQRGGAHHSAPRKILGLELTRCRGASEKDRLAQSLIDVSVDLNPHQIEAMRYGLPRH